MLTAFFKTNIGIGIEENFLSNFAVRLHKSMHTADFDVPPGVQSYRNICCV